MATWQDPSDPRARERSPQSWQNGVRHTELTARDVVHPPGGGQAKFGEAQVAAYEGPDSTERRLHDVQVVSDREPAGLVPPEVPFPIDGLGNRRRNACRRVVHRTAVGHREPDRKEQPGPLGDRDEFLAERPRRRLGRPRGGVEVVAGDAELGDDRQCGSAGQRRCVGVDGAEVRVRIPGDGFELNGGEARRNQA